MQTNSERDILTRDDLQNEALHILARDRRLILNWGTGVGKSRVAVNAIDFILAKHPESTFLLVVQETNHKLNWRNEFRDAKGEERASEILSRVVIECYASLDKYRNTGWSLIVFDEGHHLRSDLKQEIISTMKADRVLLLSATLSDHGDGDDLVRTLQRTFGSFQHLTFGIQDAIDNGILGIPDINIIPVVLTPEQREKYDELSASLEERKADYFRARHEAGLEGDDPDDEETGELKGKWLFAGGLRKRFLGSKKTGVARTLIRNVLSDRRYICFCASVKQVEWLKGGNYICSKMTKKENTAVIEAFNAGEIDSIYAVGMLQEGQNLAGIEAGLLIQLDGKERSFVQKFGRVMRSKMPVLYLLYMKDTRDEDYLANALQGINKEYIHRWKAIDTEGREVPELLERAEEKPSVVSFHAPGARRSRDGESIFEVDQAGGAFRTGAHSADTLEGTLTGVGMSDLPFPMYTFHMISPGGDRFRIQINKKLSISLVALLCGAGGLKGRTLTIKVSSDGKFAQYSARLDGRSLGWAADFRVPPVSGGDYTRRLAYLDSAVGRINSNCQKTS